MTFTLRTKYSSKKRWRKCQKSKIIPCKGKSTKTPSFCLDIVLRLQNSHINISNGEYTSYLRKICEFSNKVTKETNKKTFKFLVGI